MAQITLILSDESAARILNAVAAKYRWTAEAGTVAKLTQLEWIERALIEEMKEETLSYESSLAAQSAWAAAREVADIDIVIPDIYKPKEEVPLL